ncbi:TonB-dependent receptor [Roseateles chitinivorans]|uniref:TonB-dependent receptor n=1 Tax=Roseateles chitinivorans TaxID=2917965 RepID=UPI003D66C52C
MTRSFKRTPVCLVLAALPWSAMAQQDATAPAPAATASAPASGAPSTPTSGPAATIDAVTVFGSGQSRQVNALRPSDLGEALPGSSPLAVLNKLPGVNFQSADAFGAYEWSTKLTIRGFGQNQLGYTLDDVPLGDMSYRNHNGLHISRAIATENIGDVRVSQGAGSLQTASSSNLGGTIEFRSLDPSPHRGAHAETTFGEDALRRTFVRLDSGAFAGDTRLAISVVDQRSDKWKGQGQQRQQQFNSKLVSTLGDVKLSAFLNYSRREEVDYQDLSKEMIGRLGTRWDNYYADWNAALRSARGQWSRGETSIDDAYYAGSGQRRDVLTGVTLDWGITDQVGLKTTLYHHRDEGPSLWFTPYAPSSDAVPVSLRTVEYGIRRSGVLSTLEVSTGAHDLRAGFWLEDNRFDQAMRFYSQAAGPISPYDAPRDPTSTRWDYRFDTRTLQFHVADSIRLSSQLRADVGFKSLVSADSVHTRSGPEKTGSIDARGRFLPQLGVNWKLAPAQELFASASRNLRAYKAAAMEDSPFASTDAGFQATRGQLRPERSTTVEGGWRYRDLGASALEASITAYHVDFKHRLLAIQQGAAIEGNPSVLANVGRVKTHGVEAGLSWSPLRHLRWWNTLSFNDAKYRDDFIDNGVLVATAGKQVVDAPRWLANTSLRYDDGQWFGQLGAHYASRRYYTYLNDNSVSGATRWDLSAGVKRPGGGLVKSWRVQVSVSNLFDKDSVAAIGTNGFVTSDPNGTAQTLLLAAPRTAAITVAGDF